MFCGNKRWHHHEEIFPTHVAKSCMSNREHDESATFYGFHLCLKEIQMCAYW